MVKILLKVTISYYLIYEIYEGTIFLMINFKFTTKEAILSTPIT